MLSLSNYPIYGSSFETLVPTYQSTRRYIPQDLRYPQLQQPRCSHRHLTVHGNIIVHSALHRWQTDSGLYGSTSRLSPFPSQATLHDSCQASGITVNQPVTPFLTLRGLKPGGAEISSSPQPSRPDPWPINHPAQVVNEVKAAGCSAVG